MAKNDRKTRNASFRLESLETRNLLTIIGAKPTIDAMNGPGVHHNRFGGINIVQPATIQVFGTAQPGSPGSTVQVSIYAEDSEGNLVNGGAPLATVTPDLLGRYRTIVSLPSMIRKDVNFLVARETASAVETSTIAINGTTLNGLTANLTLNPGTLSGLNGAIANPGNTISNLGGGITTPSTPISGIAGTITIPLFPTTGPGGAGTAGPAVGTIIGGTGTLGAQVGTLAGGTGTLGATTSTLTQTGTAAESGRTGTLTDGTGNIAATTGTSTRLVQEVATSDPLVVLIHQPKNVGVFFSRATHPRANAHGAANAISYAKSLQKHHK